MRITFDSEVDALYIGFVETTAATVPVAAGIAANYAPDGRIAGIGILDAPQRFGDPGVFRRAVLEDVALERPAL